MIVLCGLVDESPNTTLFEATAFSSVLAAFVFWRVISDSPIILVMVGLVSMAIKIVDP